MKIGFIGGGNMAEAMIKGIVRSKGAISPEDIVVSESRDERRQYIEQAYGIKTASSNTEVVSSCNIIILAVKPQAMEGVLDEISGAVNNKKTVVSIAAGITLSYLSSKLNIPNIIRVMPNTPALIQEGMSVISTCGDCIPDKDIRMVKDILMSIGRVLVLPEKQMDSVTSLSGSGPAFFAFFVESMIEGAVKIGLDQDDAAALAVQTAIGTSKLLDTGMSPKALREMVTSPGGTTAAGLGIFEKRELKGIITEAIEAAAKRAHELGEKRG